MPRLEEVLERRNKFGRKGGEVYHMAVYTLYNEGESTQARLIISENKNLFFSLSGDGKKIKGEEVGKKRGLTGKKKIRSPEKMEAAADPHSRRVSYKKMKALSGGGHLGAA